MVAQKGWVVITDYFCLMIFSITNRRYYVTHRNGEADLVASDTQKALGYGAQG